MAASEIESNLEKAKAFFQRAEEVAATDNFDYAIDMYIEGLRRAPDALEDGHLALRRMALIRQGKGGKKPSIAEKMKHHGGKSPVEEMLNAEFLLAKDPDNVSYACQMLKAAVAGQNYRTAEWIAQLVFDANNATDKPSLTTYLLLKDSYATMHLYDKAVDACRRALAMRPDDSALQDELRNLSAQMTMQKGKYDGAGDFKESIRDRKRQTKLQAQEKAIKSVDYRKSAVEEARHAYDQNPESQIAITNLAEALYELDTVESFREAVSLLEKAYQNTKHFAFKKLEGELRIRRFKKEIRALRAEYEKNPENSELRAKLTSYIEAFAQFELEHFKACVKRYPMDMSLKYEYGLRLVANKQFDAAIPYLQDAQKDPRIKLAAMEKTGWCFFLKGWYSDAVDIFTQALQLCKVKSSAIAKELRYNLARSFEEMGNTDKALDIYRKLAQLDYDFKDVSERVDQMRSRSTGESTSQS